MISEMREGRCRTRVRPSRKDLAFVDRLEPRLRELGVELLIDRSEIYAFEDWWTRLQGLIKQADTILFVLSPDSATSDICRREVEFALALNKRFAPVVARTVEPSIIPDALARLNFVFLDSEEHFATGIDRLVDALGTDIDWVRSHSHYGALALDWSPKGRPRSPLLRPPHLDEAEFWIARRPAGAPLPTGETQDFIVSSRQAATRRRTAISGGLAFGLVLALALASVAWWQRQVAERAEAEAVTQRDAAERNFRIAKTTVNRVIFDFAQGLQNVEGVRLSVLRNVLTRVETAITRLTEAAPQDLELQHDRATMLDEFGNTYRVAGDGPAALAVFEEGLRVMRALLGRDPGNTGWRRDLAVSLGKVGDLNLSLGDADAALALYEEALAIRRALVERDPGQAEWQNDLAGSLNRIGDVKLRIGNAAGALAAYDESLVVRRKLVEREPNNALWQRELVLSLDKVGQLKLRSGDASGALTVFEEGLIIRQALVRLEPDSTQARRDLAISLDRVGDVRLRLGNGPGALSMYEEALGIRRALSRGDPDNALWLRDLAVSLNKVGDVKGSAGDLAGARAAYDEWLAIARVLVARDPDNTQWLRDLSVCLFRVGDLRLKGADREGALAVFDEGLAIQRTLVAREPSNALWQRDLSVSLNRIGRLRAEAGDAEAARFAFEESLAIRRDLARRDPGNTLGQTDLAASLQNTASLTPDASRKRALLDEALSILLRLQAAGRLRTTEKGWPDEVREELAAIP